MNKCSHLFSHGSLNGKGVYYTDLWDFGDADIIRALNLHLTITRLPEDKPIWKVLNVVITKQQPIMILNWPPNWTDVRIKGKFIDFPKYTVECESDPSWGINNSIVKDCGNPKSGG
jgi:glycine betaine/proline transport system substrate-binding protein